MLIDAEFRARERETKTHCALYPCTRRGGRQAREVYFLLVVQGYGQGRFFPECLGEGLCWGNVFGKFREIYMRLLNEGRLELVFSWLILRL